MIYSPKDAQSAKPVKDKILRTETPVKSTLTDDDEITITLPGMNLHLNDNGTWNYETEM